mmetsp:Transcript_40552/g.94835  ORF Transcript_40552/g.94835 Transcript_40552/m.94835 type:complete len:212 (-) Transcript_40552:646-1281(-)
MGTRPRHTTWRQRRQRACLPPSTCCRAQQPTPRGTRTGAWRRPRRRDRAGCISRAHDVAPCPCSRARQRAQQTQAAQLQRDKHRSCGDGMRVLWRVDRDDRTRRRWARWPCRLSASTAPQSTGAPSPRRALPDVSASVRRRTIRPTRTACPDGQLSSSTAPHGHSPSAMWRAARTSACCIVLRSSDSKPSAGSPPQPRPSSSNSSSQNHSR